ncbi:MAG: hypothetical protein ACTSRZ_03135 [Promethearchaeota archaeon]
MVREKNSTKNIERIYVFDANFFIALKNLKIPKYLEHLKRAKEELNLKFLISNLVFNELPFIKGNARKIFEDLIEVVNISETAIEWVKEDLSSMGVFSSRFAQDPDLSLISLSRKVLDKKKRVFLISDDFKLGENLKTLNYSIEFLSPSAFILFLAKNCKDKELKMYFADLHKKMLKYNLEYMLERKEKYNPLTKLMFLIENSIKISNDGIDLMGINKAAPLKESSKFQSVCIDDADIKDATVQRIENECNKYLLSEPLKDISEIILMIPLLDKIKTSKDLIKKAKYALKEDKTGKAINILNNASDIIKKIVQISASILPKEQYYIFQKVAFTELSNTEFIRSFLLIGQNNLDLALESLDASATFASLGRVKKSSIPINYLKALILMFNNLYDLAIEQYKFTEELAINYAANDLFIYKCKIGRAITMFLSGMQNDAISIFNEINSEIKDQNLETTIEIFQELGDYFYAMGKPKLSIALYREALECAVDSQKLKWKKKIIVEKMKRAYLNAMLEGNKEEESINIDMIIDRAHDLKNMDEFNETIAELALFNAMIYSEMEYTDKDEYVSYFDLPDFFKDKYDIVDIIEGEKTSVLIGFNKDVGLIGFRVKFLSKLKGLPENYTIKLKKNAKVKILRPSNKLRAKYLIRAIVSTKPNHVEINRNIPVFFSQIQV